MNRNSKTAASPPCILIVDDDRAILRVGQRALAAAGFRVLSAQDGGEALELLSDTNNDIALVILDVTMPQMSGAETLRRLREVHETIPVVLASGVDQGSLSVVFDECCTFIQKPFQLRELLHTIRARLEQ